MEQTPGRSFRHRFEGPFFRRLFVGGIRNIPQPIQRVSMPFWAGFFFAFLSDARHRAERNLEQILGPANPFGEQWRTFRLFVNYAQTLTNMYALHLGQGLPVEVDFQGRENVLRVIEGGRGVVAVTGHLGAWQLMPFLIERGTGVALPAMTMAMAEEPNAQVSEFEKQFRSKFRVVYTTRSPFALLELHRVLERREIVGMQLDRHPGGAHVMIPFCGRLAPFPVGPAMLARTAQCPIIPVFAISPTPDRKRVTIHYEKPIEVPKTRDRDADISAAMHKVVAVYEDYVRRYPDQWFNFYDFWRSPGESS